MFRKSPMPSMCPCSVSLGCIDPGPGFGTVCTAELPVVRFAPALSDYLSTPHSAASPFKLVNAPNVQLETIKRAEDDDHSSNKATLIVRLFEQLGGHAKPTLKVYVLSLHSPTLLLASGVRFCSSADSTPRSGLKIVKAEIANILEDSIDSLKVTSIASTAAGDGKDESEIKLSFRGFEVKTLKLTVEKAGHKKRLVSTASSPSLAASSSAIQNDGWIKL